MQPEAADSDSRARTGDPQHGLVDMDMTSDPFSGRRDDKGRALGLSSGELSRSLERPEAWQAWLLAVTAIGLTLGAGVAFGPDAWFEALRKPTWQPPNWLFGPVWTSLYAMLAIALALLLRAPPGAERTRALRWFAAQLVLNALWTPLFFGLHSPGLAFVDIALLWVAMIGSIMAAFQAREASAWLQVPTLVWVSFALVLNGVILALNL